MTGRVGDGGGGSDDTSLIDLSHDPIRMPPTQYPNPSHELFESTLLAYRGTALMFVHVFKLVVKLVLSLFRAGPIFGFRTN